MPIRRTPSVSDGSSLRWSSPFGLPVVGVGVRSRRVNRAEAVLERARSDARSWGYDPSEIYEPYLPTHAFQQVLLTLHDALGDSACAVVVAALMLRLATLPWNLSALQLQCDKARLLPVYSDLVKALELARRRRGGGVAEERGAGVTAREAEKAEADFQVLTAKLKDFTETTRFSPLQGLGYQVQCLLPAFALGYLALRGLAAHPDSFRGFVASPSLWLESLVLPDPLGILPVVSALAVLSSAELNSPPPASGQEENAEYMRLAVRGALLLFVPITSALPSAALVFMATNAAYTAAITWAFRRYRWVPSVQVEPRWLVPQGMKPSSTGPASTTR